jgi:hypothetical protein
LQPAAGATLVTGLPRCQRLLIKRRREVPVHLETSINARHVCECGQRRLRILDALDLAANQEHIGKRAIMSGTRANSVHVPQRLIDLCAGGVQASERDEVFRPSEVRERDILRAIERWRYVEHLVHDGQRGVAQAVGARVCGNGR